MVTQVSNRNVLRITLTSQARPKQSMRLVLRNTQFLRLFGGRLVTNAGDSIYFIAAMWLVWDLTGSSLYTGMAGFLVQVPNGVRFLVGPLVDRWSIRRILVGTQAVQAIAVLAVPFAAWTGHLTVWIVLLLMPVLSLLNQFVYPAQNAALPRIVAEEQLPRANSLLSAAYQSADAVFNAVSGLLISLIGGVVLYVVDAVTFAIAAVLFLGLCIPGGSADQTDDSQTPSAQAEDDGDTSYLADLRAGITYLRGSALLAAAFGSMVGNLAFGAMFGVLPAYAAGLGGPDTYGLLMGAFGGGMLTGTVGASLVEDQPYGRFTIVSSAVSSVSLGIAFAVGWLPITVTLFFIGIIPIGAFNVLFRSLLQSTVAQSMIGRVSAVVSSLSMMMVPIGSLLGGALAGFIGAQTVLYGLAVAQGFLSVYFLAQSELRQLPPIFDADESTLGLGTSDDTQ